MPEYIEKATLVQKLHAEADKCKIGEGDTLAGLYLANCMVDELPAADVAPVLHGRWTTNTDDFTPKRRCSVCGYNKPIMAGEGIKQGPENYCPNCGAKMVGEA